MSNVLETRVRLVEKLFSPPTKLKTRARDSKTAPVGTSGTTTLKFSPVETLPVIRPLPARAVAEAHDSTGMEVFDASAGSSFAWALSGVRAATAPTTTDATAVR